MGVYGDRRRLHPGGLSMCTSLLLSLALALPQAQSQPEAKPIPAGKGEIKVDVGSKKLTVYTYRPKSYKDGPLIVIFHGTNRNADEYRDFGKGMAERFGALVVAPPCPCQNRDI